MRGRTWKEGDGGERMENKGEGQGNMKKDRELQRTGKDRKGEGERGKEKDREGGERRKRRGRKWK